MQTFWQIGTNYTYDRSHNQSSSFIKQRRPKTGVPITLNQHQRLIPQLTFKKRSKEAIFTFLKSVARTVPSSDILNSNFFPVLPSITASDPPRFLGGGGISCTETGDLSSGGAPPPAAETAARWPERTARRARARAEWSNAPSILIRRERSEIVRSETPDFVWEREKRRRVGQVKRRRSAKLMCLLFASGVYRRIYIQVKFTGHVYRSLCFYKIQSITSIIFIFIIYNL